MTAELEKWVSRYDRGVVNRTTFLCLVSTLYDTTSGLIDRSVSALIADIHRDLLNEIKKEKAQ